MVSGFAAFLVALVVLGGLLGLGEWIAIALGLTGLVGLVLFNGTLRFPSLADIGYNTVNDFVLTAVPLFIFAGELILGSGLSDRFYRGIAVWLNRVPGRLLQSNILACGVFAAVSGSSVATAAAIGTVAIPELRKRGYEDRMVLGSLAGGGTLGILIPPSIPMIIYAALVNTSVADLFLAGILPGIVLMLIFMAYIAVRVLLQPELVPSEAERFTWGERLRASLGVLPVALLILTIIGGLYAGVMTPTEAAAVAALLALVLGALVGQLRWRELLTSVAKTVQATCMVILILVGAQVLSFAMTNNGINREVSQAVVGLHLPPAAFYVAIVLLYTLLGMFVDGLSMLLLTLPVLYPIVQQMGFDPIWFGIVLVIMIEMGQVTPPVGLNLFVIHGMAGGRPLSDVVRGALPYGALMYILLALLWFWPTLALALVHRPA